MNADADNRLAPELHDVPGEQSRAVFVEGVDDRRGFDGLVVERLRRLRREAKVKVVNNLFDQVSVT